MFFGVIHMDQLDIFFIKEKLIVFFFFYLSEKIKFIINYGIYIICVLEHKFDLKTTTTTVFCIMIFSFEIQSKSLKYKFNIFQ